MRGQHVAIPVTFLIFFSFIRTGLCDGKQRVLPRYHLSPGLELTYSALHEFKSAHDEIKEPSTYIFDLVKVNPDQGWHVVGRLLLPKKAGDAAASSETMLTAFDVHPDGTATLSPGVRGIRGIPWEFPTLPADQSQLIRGWNGDRSFGAHGPFKLLPSATPALMEFTGDDVDPAYKIYQITCQTTYRFDTAGGVLVSETAKLTKGTGLTGTGTDAATLTMTVTKPEKWLRQFSRDCAVYFDAQEKYLIIREKTGLSAAECDSGFAAAKDLLTAARKQIVSPEISGVLDRDLAELPGMAQSVRHDAENLRAILNKPAPEWTLPDQSGVMHSLKDYRGTVVVLDFWFRSCFWCMRAMPEMKQWSDDLSGKPVVMLGMNTDTRPADIKFVVDAFELKYPNLNAPRALTDQYHAEGFPMVIIIGPDGIVRDVEVGYTPGMEKRLTAKMTPLLQKADNKSGPVGAP